MVRASLSNEKLFYCITRDFRLAINLVLEYLCHSLATIKWTRLADFQNCKHFIPNFFPSTTQVPFALLCGHPVVSAFTLSFPFPFPIPFSTLSFHGLK